MKIFASLVVTLASAMAVAYPAINDRASFSGTYSIQGQDLPVTLQMEVTSISGSMVTVTQTSRIENQTSTEQQTANISDMATSAQVQELLASCPQAGGRFETITVAAGTYPTCHVGQEGSDAFTETWIGDVPFQIIRLVQISKKNGAVLTLELSSYKNGP